MTENGRLIESVNLIDAKLKRERERLEFFDKEMKDCRNEASYFVDGVSYFESIGAVKALYWCRVVLGRQLLNSEEEENEDEDDE